MQLNGAIAVVTGASSGIGEATAWDLAAQGATVVIAARRVERLEGLATAIRERGQEVLVIACDVQELADIEAMRDAVLASYGRCDVLVNNAGVPGGGRFETLSQGQIEAVVRTNVIGLMQATRAFLPSMQERGSGHIINIASLAGRHATPGAAVYSSTKHAVSAFSEALAGEVVSDGIRVTSINPGFAWTESFPQTKMPGLLVMNRRRISRAVVRAVLQEAGPQVSVPRWAGAMEVLRMAGPVYRAGMRQLVSKRSKIQEPHRPPE